MTGLTDLRTALVKGAFRVMQSPQFVRLLQDRRVLAILVEGLSVKASGRVALREAGKALARTLGLATLEDLRAVEQDLRERAAPAGGGVTRPAEPTARDLRFGESAASSRYGETARR
jgi:hypothetical protein